MTNGNDKASDFVVDADDGEPMVIRSPLFLPGVPEDLIRAALAVNGFGWFLERAVDLPVFPSLSNLDWPASKVDVERQMRFPWSGGRHPWLDAAVETASHLIGVESKRFEPFRDAKTVSLSPAYDRDVWGEQMIPFTTMRDRLRSGEAPYLHLDGAQLVKHAFGLVTEGRRLDKIPVLLYLYAEPSQRGAVVISPEAIARHRAEIADFATAVAGAEVRFAACSWGEWLAGWTGDARTHADALTARFQP